MSTNILPKEESVEFIILYRSLYILKKKFEKYKEDISKIYTKYFVKDKNNYNNIRCKIIKISSFKSLLQQICNLVNMSIIKISSLNELFVSDLVSQKIQQERFNESIDQIYNYISDNLKKYNEIFFNKKIKPIIEINKIDNINEDLTEYYPIVEYNKKGDLICYYDQMKEKNKKYSSILKSHEITLEKEYELNEKENDILYIETLPVLIADFIQENPKYIIINSDVNDNELNNEIKNLFDGNILKKVERENKILKREINLPHINNEMRLQELLNQQLGIEKNIKLYQDLLNEKKKSGHDIKYIEDFLSKLNEEKKKINEKIKEEENKEQNNNHQKKNIYSISSISTNSNITKTNLTKSKTVKFKISLNELREEQKMINSLKEIFDFYANQHYPMASAPTFDEIAFRKINLDLAEFSKFCVEFEIPITKQKMSELFKKNTSNRKDMSFTEFKNSLEKIAQAMNDSKKEKLLHKIKLYKEILGKFKDTNDIIQDFKRKSIYIHENDINNPNKNNIRNSHRLTTHKASILFDNKKKLYENELKEAQNELDKLKKLSYKGVFDEFIKFMGFNEPKIYRKKMKGFIIPFHDMTERVLEYKGGYKYKKISRDEIIDRMKRDLRKVKNNDNKFNNYYLKKLREQKEKEDKKNEIYEKRMKEFIEDKKRKIAILKEEEKKEKERIEKSKLTAEDIKKQKELEEEKEREKEREMEREKERIELERKEAEEKRKEEEKKIEEDKKRNVFSYDRIEKSEIDDINLDEELNKDFFIEDDSQNSDEEILNNFGNNNKEKKRIESSYNNNIDENQEKEERVNYLKTNLEDYEKENVLITQPENKNIVLLKNKNSIFNKRNQSLDFDSKNNNLTETTHLYIHKNQKLNLPFKTDNKIENNSESNLIYSLKSKRKSNSQTFIKAGENIVKENKRQISAYYGKNNSNNYIPFTSSNINDDREYNKKRQLLFAGKVKRNKELLLKNQMIENAKLIKKIEMLRNNENNNDFNIRKNLEQ